MADRERLSIMATLPDTAWVEFNRFGTGADIMEEETDWLKEVDAIVQSTVTCSCVELLAAEEAAAAFLGAGVLATLGKLLAAGPSGLARVARTKTQDTPVEVSVLRIIGRPPSVKLAVMASPRGSENPIRLFSSFKQKVRLVGWPIL